MSEKGDIGARDLFGIAPVARAVERVTDSVLSGAEATLGRICLPAAEELGLLFRDKVSAWRQRNVLSTVTKAQPALDAAAAKNCRASPRLIMESLNQASWTDREEVQAMWAGLLVSSCTESGIDDSNWIFINLLSQLTTLQVSILNAACESATKVVTIGRLIAAKMIRQSQEELIALCACKDLQRIDRELDHLRALGLIEGGILPNSEISFAEFCPTALALHLYVRAQGSAKSPSEYFHLNEGG
jgi:hypothetical protein